MPTAAARRGALMPDPKMRFDCFPIPKILWFNFIFEKIYSKTDFVEFITKKIFFCSVFFANNDKFGAKIEDIARKKIILNRLGKARDRFQEKNLFRNDNRINCRQP